MSWYVQHLLLDADSIRSRTAIEDLHEEMLDIDLEEDQYLDLLSVEMKIKELSDCKVLDEQEIFILDMVKKGNSFKYLEGKLSLSRPTIYKIFREACTKIAFSLGDYFSDDGYLDYIRNKYHLQDEDVNKISKIIKGKN